MPLLKRKEAISLFSYPVHHLLVCFGQVTARAGLRRAAIADHLQACDVHIGIGLAARLGLFVLFHLRLVRLGHHLLMTGDGHSVVHMRGEVGLAAEFIYLYGSRAFLEATQPE